jgi:hypothetical protein
MVIRIFAKFIFTERKRLARVIFQLDVMHNWPQKLPQKSMDEKLSLCHSDRSIVIHKPQNGVGGVARLMSTLIQKRLGCHFVEFR